MRFDAGGCALDLKGLAVHTPRMKQPSTDSLSTGQRHTTPGGLYISRDGLAEATSGKIDKRSEAGPRRSNSIMLLPQVTYGIFLLSQGRLLNDAAAPRRICKTGHAASA